MTKESTRLFYQKEHMFQTIYQLPEVKSWDLIPVSKDGNPPPKAGNPVKAEKNEVVPRFLLPRGPRRVPKKSSNGSSGNKHMHFVNFCSMSLFHGKAVMGEQEALEESWPQLTQSSCNASRASQRHQGQTQPAHHAASVKGQQGFIHSGT